MIDRCGTFRDCRTTIHLSFLKVSHLYTILCGFYESSNKQNRMCELCTFSQIRSHMMTAAIDVPACREEMAIKLLINSS